MTDLTTLNTKETTMTRKTTPPVSVHMHGLPNTADHYLDTWIATMQREVSNDNILFGRIIRTNINFIVKGYNYFGEWKEIPCANIHTAKMYLGRIMSVAKFTFHTNINK